jgi:hypothetical protein
VIIEMSVPIARIGGMGNEVPLSLFDEAAAADAHQHHQVIFEPELVVRQST